MAVKQLKVETRGLSQIFYKEAFLPYSRLITLPAIGRNDLLICPGIFTNHDRWKGISNAELLKLAGADEGITHVSIRGRRDALQKRNIPLFLMPKNLAGCVSRVWAIVLNQKE